MFPTLLLRQIHPSPIGFGFWLWQLYDWLWPSAHHSSSSRSIMTTERCCTATTGLKKASAAQNQQDENLEVGIVVAWNVRLGSSSSSSRLNAFFYCFDSNYSACHFWKQSELLDGVACSLSSFRVRSRACRAWIYAILLHNFVTLFGGRTRRRISAKSRR